MKTYLAITVIAALVPGCIWLWRAESAAKWRRVLGDVIFAAMVGVVMLFLSHNGFVGHSDIQAYPY